ncbi:MAG TPA: HPr family phosphocarrier protein [Candidatus Binataceae bacterium]
MGFNFSDQFTRVLVARIVYAVSVVEATAEVKNRLGLHLRAASTLAQAAGRFSSKITIARGKNQVSAKSITGLMMLGAEKGVKVKIRAEGEDARDALKTVETLFEERFGEE